MASQTQTQYDQATRTAGTAGQTAGSYYLGRATTFDPYAAAERSAQGQFGSFRTALNRDLSTLRGQQVGMGRLNSGWAQSGEDELVTHGLEDLNNRIAANSLAAAGLDEQNFSNVGNYGLAQTGMYNDLLSGKLDRDQAAANAKRARRGGLLGGLGAVAGLALGGPEGAAVGQAAGQGLGSFFG
jgi:hypothetical protein